MNKINIEAGQPGTADDNNTNAQNQQVRQPNANTNVVGSREIKFRFWLGHIRKMTYEHSLSEIGKIIPDFTEDIVPLQYTGLKDKNGKEIYEGDVLRMSYSRDTTGKDIVVFSEVVEFQINEGTGTTGFEISFLQTSEIIGNVFENPELV